MLRSPTTVEHSGKDLEHFGTLSLGRKLTTLRQHLETKLSWTWAFGHQFQQSQALVNEHQRVPCQKKRAQGPLGHENIMRFPQIMPDFDNETEWGWIWLTFGYFWDLCPRFWTHLLWSVSIPFSVAKMIRVFNDFKIVERWPPPTFGRWIQANIPCWSIFVDEHPIIVDYWTHYCWTHPNHWYAQFLLVNTPNCVDRCPSLLMFIHIVI